MSANLRLILNSELLYFGKVSLRKWGIELFCILQKEKDKTFEFYGRKRSY